ncbi:MAG TPA: adenylate/guanylate cyclase domain-containing protein [Solimonas sp.]|nr:adenylate/guanylate cyclase domain-containing protein [Solimonas sp.]
MSEVTRQAADSVATIMFADVVGSTALYRKLGDVEAEKLVRGGLDRLRLTAERHGGKQIKTIGDCSMCRFGSPVSAAEAALDIQRGAALPLTGAGDIVKLRVGFCDGPIVERDGDVFGDAVNIAARLCDMAKADQILTTESTTSQFPPTLRSQVRLFDKTPVKGIKDVLTIVQLIGDRRAATEMFVLPDDISSVSVALQLHYRDQVINLVAANMPYVMGKDPTCNLVVPGQFSSRKHAHLEYRRGKFTLVDESTNGTFIMPDGGAAGGRHVYIRNEAFTLVGKGRFALGTKPETDEHALGFEVS